MGENLREANMKEARVVKKRRCKHCNREQRWSAEKLREHVETHRLAERAERSGLVIASPRVLTLEEVNERRN